MVNFIKAFSVVLILSTSSSARECSFSRQYENSNLGKLEGEILAAGRNISALGIQCTGKECKLWTSDATCPTAIVSAHVWVDSTAQTDLITTQAKVLLRKLKVDRANMTQDERDELLLRLGYLLLTQNP